MKENVEIVIDDNIYLLPLSGDIDTGIYINFNGKCFPSEGWNDMASWILPDWTHKLMMYKNGENFSFRCYFLDGPFFLKVFKNDKMELTIDCINEEPRRKVEMTIQCGYYEFLECLYNANKKFIKILYQKGLNQGEFAGVYTYGLQLIKELRARLKEKKV